MEQKVWGWKGVKADLDCRMRGSVPLLVVGCVLAGCGARRCDADALGGSLEGSVLVTDAHLS